MKVLPINTSSYYASKNQKLQNQPQTSASNVHFGGLSRLLSKKIYPDGQKEIMELISQRSPRASKTVGQLPGYIFDRIVPTQRQKAIPEIMAVFDSVVKSIRDFKPAKAQSGSYRPQFANDMLTDVFREFGIIDKKDSINLKYLGTGPSSKTFLLEGIGDPKNGDKYLLKVYHELFNPVWHAAKRNGLYSELNTAMYWRAHEGLETQKGKFFFGSLDSGFMLTKYLDNSVAKPRRVVNPYKYGMVYDERTPKSILLNIHDSTVNGYNYRYSGLAVVNKVKNSSKEARYFMEQVKKSGYNVVNKKLKGMSPERLEAYGLAKEGKKLVVTDNKVFENSGLIMRENGEIVHVNNQKRLAYWKEQMALPKKSENMVAGLAMGIKHLPAHSRVECLQECLQYNMPKVDQGLAYLLKYLPNEEAMKYFDILMKRGNSETQTILLNEIPLLSRRKLLGVKVADDINVSPADVVPERVEKYYEMAKQSVNNDAVEHLASFLNMLPETSKYKYYKYLSEIDMKSVQERLEWNNESLPIHIKAQLVKEHGLDPSYMGETFIALKQRGMSDEAALRIMGL